MKDRNLMKRWSKTVLLSCILLLCASLVQAGPVLLKDSILDQVTAGNSEVNGSGGAIVGNSSEAVINLTGSVDLSDNFQLEARGLNLVNSTASTVANGVNVWDGEDISGMLDVNQVNNIYQEDRRSAEMSGYSRPEADTFVHTERSESGSYDKQISRHSSVTDIHTNERVTNSDSSSEVNTLIKVSIGDKMSLEANVGQGIAVAGHLEAEYDGGEAEFAMSVGGGIQVGADIGGSDDNDLIIGGINLGETGVKAGVSVEASLSLYADIKLPEMKIELNGVGCGVVMGSCQSSGTMEETTTEIIDNSTLDTLEETTVSSSAYSEVKTEVYRSPFELKNARAEYIVIDNSSLVVNTDYTLRLTGSVQSNVRGMNIVNAVGSTVANGVNVARNTRVGGESGLTLIQSNVITHGR